MAGWEDIVVSLGLTGLDVLKERKGRGRGGKDQQTRIVFGVQLMRIWAELRGVEGAVAAQALLQETLQGLGHARAIKAAYAAVKATADEDDEDFESAL